MSNETQGFNPPRDGQFSSSSGESAQPRFTAPGAYPNQDSAAPSAGNQPAAPVSSAAIHPSYVAPPVSYGAPSTTAAPLTSQSNYAMEQPTRNNAYSQGFDPRTGVWAHYRPGIIPIRPLQWSEIVGASFRVITYNFKATMALTLLVIVISILYLIVSSTSYRSFHTDAGTTLFQSMLSNNLKTEEFLRYFLSSLIMIFGISFGFTIYSQVVLAATAGRKLKAREAIREALVNKGEVFKFILAAAAISSIFGIISTAITKFSEDTTGFLLLPVFLVTLFISMLLNLKLSHGLIAVSAERHDFKSALKRGWYMTKGLMGKSIAVMIVIGTLSLTLFVIIYTFIAILLSLVFAVTIEQVGSSYSSPGEGAAAGALVLVILFIIFVIVAMLLFCPLALVPAMASLTLLYVDGRFRREGADVTWMNSLFASAPGASLPVSHYQPPSPPPTQGGFTNLQ